MAFSKHSDKDSDGIDNDKDNDTADITRSLSEETEKISGAHRLRWQGKSNKEKWPLQNMVIKIMKKIMTVFIMIKMMTPDITQKLCQIYPNIQTIPPIKSLVVSILSKFYANLMSILLYTRIECVLRFLLRFLI